jgi:hypothetical protein
MTDYLARLKTRSGQKHISNEPTKLTKPAQEGEGVGFVGFGSDIGGRFTRANGGGPMTDNLARLKARSEQNHIRDEPTKPTKPSQEGKEVGFVGFGSDLGGRFSQVSSVVATRPTEHSATCWTEADEERAAIVECDGGAPRAWAEGFARLDRARPPDDMPHWRWLRFIDDCGRFLDGGWAAQAAALGWGAADLFGCDRYKPFVRVDRMGLLWLLNGRTSDCP